MKRFVIDTKRIINGHALLDQAETRHLARVLRLGPGDRVCLLDSEGFEHEAVIDRTNIDQQTSLTLVGTRKPDTESNISIRVGVALLKEKKIDQLIRPLSELGATELCPFLAKRSVPKPDGRRLAKRLERWQTIALEAVKQCGRAKPLIIAAPVTLTGLFIGQNEAGLLFYENTDQPFSARACGLEKKGVRRFFLLFGPEGGFEETEAQQAIAMGFTPVRIGPRILRAETAVISATALIQHRFGDLG